MRKELSDDKTEEQPAETSEKPAEEEIDIDLNDPQTEEAAVKIQVEMPFLTGLRPFSSPG